MENILSELFIYIQSILSILCEIFHVKSPIFGVFAWNISHILCQTVGSTQEYILWWEIRSVTETDLPILWGQLYESIYSLTYAYVLREYILYLVRRMAHQPSLFLEFLVSLQRKAKVHWTAKDSMNPQSLVHYLLSVYSFLNNRIKNNYIGFRENIIFIICIRKPSLRGR